MTVIFVFLNFSDLVFFSAGSQGSFSRVAVSVVFLILFLILYFSRPYVAVTFFSSFVFFNFSDLAFFSAGS